MDDLDFMVPTFTIRDFVTTSTRPLSGTLTISLSHEAWDGIASAVIDTFITPKKDQQTQCETELNNVFRFC